MNSRSGNVAIIGGGISGLTTATLLQLNGYKTTIYTLELPTPTILQSLQSPRFASLHAAASILPHSVKSPKVNYWTEISQEYFRILAFIALCGVREQTHYEIFEKPLLDAPDYWRSLRNFEQLTNADLLHDGVPRRPAADFASGWRFDAIFCEAPQYISYLYEFYRSLGGKVLLVNTDSHNRSIVEYLKLDHQYYVNCTGHAASALLGATDALDIDDRPNLPEYEPLNDHHQPSYLRGHYLRVDIKQLFTDGQGRFFSYNYTPSTDVYSTATGEPADVYCYPRSDCWILGGSRQVYNGPLDASEVWVGEDADVSEQDTFASQDGKQVKLPAAIFSLNDELLGHMTGGNLSLRWLRSNRPEAISPGIGFRFQRSGKSGVRLACSRVHFGSEKYVLHNYGHGGSGFALSWGCAFDLLKLLDQMTDRRGSPKNSRRAAFLMGHSATQVLLTELTQRLLNGAPPMRNV